MECMDTIAEGGLIGQVNRAPHVTVDYVARVRDFGDGEVSVTVRKCYTSRNRHLKDGALVAVRPKKVREDRDAENRERAARRARSICMDRVKAIRADRLVTLTYRENMTDRARLAADFEAFIRRLRRAGHRVQYVATTEQQKRGAWHVHMAVRGRQNYQLLRSIWRSVVGQDNGNVDVRNPWACKPLRHRLAAYLSKYVGKGFEGTEKGSRRLWCSKGIGEPITTVFGGPFEGWPAAVDRVVGALGPGRAVLGWYGARREVLCLVSTGSG